MRTIGRWLRALAAIVVAGAVGIVPGCASMGGGMKYDVMSNPPSIVGQSAAM
jgi:hypothetical protein